MIVGLLDSKSGGADLMFSHQLVTESPTRPCLNWKQGEDLYRAFVNPTDRAGEPISLFVLIKQQPISWSNEYTLPLL